MSVLLIAVCATGGAAAFARGDRSEPVLALAKAVANGDTIDADDLREVRWTPTEGVSAVPSGRRSEIVGKRASTDLRPNTLITVDQVTDGAVLQPGQVTVGVALAAEQMPVRPLTPGQHIALVSTPQKGGDTPTVTPSQIEATVVVVGRRDERSGKTVVEVAVSTQDGALLAARAYTERLAVVARQPGVGR
nr:SAF domain-containing protein [Streptomyces sp. SID3343]